MTPTGARVALVGYASLDHSIQLAGPYRPHWTTPIRSRGQGSWPRPGGCHFYAAMPIARAGAHTSLVTWVGDDDFGARYQGHCRAANMATDGIAVVENGATPLCFLVYEDDGACACLIDFGMAGRETVTTAQEAVLASADLVCMTVAPESASRRALEVIRPDAIVAWVTKNDPASFTPDLRRSLARRSRYIFCNATELGWVEDALAGARGERVIVQTNGGGEVIVHSRAGKVSLPVSPIEAGDTTGAGDTLAGGTLASILSGETDIVRATEAGIAAAAQLLRGRAEA